MLLIPGDDHNEYVLDIRKYNYSIYSKCVSLSVKILSSQRMLSKTRGTYLYKMNSL